MPPRPRFLKLAEEKRRNILDAAAEEFAARGFDGASFNKIIERAGISKGAAYYYFDDKEDLYATVFERRIDQLLEVTGDIELDELEADRFWDDVAESGRSSLKKLKPHPYLIAFFRHLFIFAEGHADSAVVAKMMSFGKERVGQFLDRGIALGVIRDDVPRDLLIELTFGLGLTLDRWIFARIDEMDESDLEDLVDTTVDLYRGMLSPTEKR